MRPRNTWRRGTSNFAAGLFIVVAGAARAADTSAAGSRDSDQWQYPATFHAYAPSPYGETTFPNGATGPTFRINAHTIVKSLNIAFMGARWLPRGATSTTTSNPAVRFHAWLGAALPWG